MNNNQLAEVAKILGVSEDIITAMYDEIKNSMTANLPSVPNRAVRPELPRPARTRLGRPARGQCKGQALAGVRVR